MGALTYRWRWCTPDQMTQRMHLNFQAPTQPFEGYERIDVPPTSKDVEDVLSASNVDSKIFDLQTDGQNLLWKLLRAEAYFMVIDGGLPSQKILVMMETVRIRFTYAGCVLIQTHDDSLLGAKDNFPGHEKPNNLSPIAAAKQMWESILNLPPDIADFVADTTEDTRIEGYRGLSCVERAFLVDVKLLHPVDTTAIKVVGLPKHQGFTTSSESDESVGGARHFKWMTLGDGDRVQDTKATKRLSLTDVESVSSLKLQSDQKDQKEGCKEKVRNFLDEAWVDMNSDHWKDGSKVEALTEELALGKCSLANTSVGIQRCVSVVCVRLWSPDRKWMVVEMGRKEPWSGEEWTVQLPGSKKTNSESIEVVVTRLCEDQLGLTEDDISFGSESTWEYFEYTQASNRYKGVRTKYQKYFVDVVLEDGEELLERLALSSRVPAEFVPEGFWSTVSRSGSAHQR